MKTNLISKAVVMLAVVMASVMNFSASASNPTQYVKNEEMTGELITAKTIFKNEDGHLFRHLRYTYTYDNENRVTSKEASKWDNQEFAANAIEPLIVEKVSEYRKANPGLGCAKLYLIVKRLFDENDNMPGRDAFIELL